MEIIRAKKRRLYGLLIQLLNLAIKNDLKEFNKINVTCTQEMNQIFGNTFKKGDEAFEWDLTKNAIVGIIQNDMLKETIPKKLYEDNKKIYMAKSNEKLEELKKYL